MNIINNSRLEYLRANRSIEIISFKNTDALMYVYNFQGQHFRVFDSILDLIQFFELGKEAPYSFENDLELDKFIKTYKFLNNYDSTL